MTAAAEHGAVRPQDVTGLRRWPVLAIAVLIGASSAFGMACTADSSIQPGVSTGGTGASSDVPDDDEQAIRRTIETLNAAAADGVAGQQAVLAKLVDPTLLDALDDCAPATTTLRFEPTYLGLRLAPGWTGSNGPSTGPIYALPTLIRIYTGDRITGTDLTTLHLGVQVGEAYLTPLCVG